MAPTKQKNQRWIWMWVAAVTSLSMLLSVGSTYSRLIDWASTELIYIPSTPAGYRSDCLSAEGQQILLSQWQPEETSRTVIISITRPVTETPEEPTPEATEPEATEPEATEPEATEPEATEPEATTPDGSDEGEMGEEEDPIQDPVADATAAPLETEEADPVTDEPSDDDTSTEGPSTEEPGPEDTTPEEPTPEDPIPVEPAPEEPPVEEIPSEVTVTPDALAAAHLGSTVTVGESTIEIILTRREDAPGLAQTATLTIQIEWFTLQGTICVDMLPYGQAAVEEIVDTEQRQVVTGLDPVKVNDTINPENPIACVILNLETLADFKLTFTQAGTPLNRVRWSLDGEQYSMLYDSHELTVAWPYPDGFDGLLYLDFTDALSGGQSPVIAVEPTEYGRREFSPLMEGLPVLTDPVIKAASLPCTMAMQAYWGDAKPLIVGLQRLVTDEEGRLIYADDLSVTPTVTNAGIVLTSAQDALHPPSGSYRLLIQWIWNETVVEEQIIYFFVNTN